MRRGQRQKQQRQERPSLLLILWHTERMTAVATTAAVAAAAVLLYPGNSGGSLPRAAAAAVPQAREREKEKQEPERKPEPEPAREREEEKQREETPSESSSPVYRPGGHGGHYPRSYRQGYEHEYYGDSSRIVFASNREGGDWEIYLTDPESREVHRLTRRRGDDIQPALSPDRRRVAYVSHDEEAGQQGIVIQDMYEGGRARRLTTNRPGADTHPAWSPDGRRIAYASNQNGDMDIYVIDANGEGRERIRLTSSPARDTMPAWSPNGHMLAFVSDREGRDALYLRDLRPKDGGDSSVGDSARRLYWPDRGSAVSSPRFSPDGRRVVFALEEESGESGLFLLEIESGNLRRLTRRRANDSSSIPARPETPAFSPDGRRIVFAAEREGRSTLFTLRLSDPDHVQRLLADSYYRRADHAHPDWR